MKESAKSCRLHGNVSYTGTWFTWVSGCVVIFFMWVAWSTWVKILFLRGSTFYVGHNFYVGCVSQLYFCVGQNSLREIIFITWVKIFCVNFFAIV